MLSCSESFSLIDVSRKLCIFRKMPPHTLQNHFISSCLLSCAFFVLSHMVLCGTSPPKT